MSDGWGKPIFPKEAYSFPIAVFPLSFFILTRFPSSLSFFLAFLGRWRFQTMPNVRSRCLLATPPRKGGGVESRDFSGAAERQGRGGAVPRAAWPQPLPLLSHLCIFYVPFVNEDLVKSLQRKGRKNFLISILAVRTGMKGDRLIEGQNVFLFLYFTFYRLGILELKRL